MIILYSVIRLYDAHERIQEKKYSYAHSPNDSGGKPVLLRDIEEYDAEYVKSTFKHCKHCNVFSFIVKEPISKKCVIKGDNMCITGPIKNLHILNAEWALIKTTSEFKICSVLVGPGTFVIQSQNMTLALRLFVW